MREPKGSVYIRLQAVSSVVAVLPFWVVMVQSGVQLKLGFIFILPVARIAKMDHFFRVGKHRHVLFILSV